MAAWPRGIINIKEWMCSVKTGGWAAQARDPW
jgi:hypothetical protein